MSYHVHLDEPLFDVVGFSLKNTATHDPSFLRERLTVQFLRSMGKLPMPPPPPPPHPSPPHQGCLCTAKADCALSFESLLTLCPGYARVTINGTLVGPFVVEERVDQRFVLSRRGNVSATAGLWKVGGNRNRVMYAPENAYAHSVTGKVRASPVGSVVPLMLSRQALFARAWDAVQHNATAALFDGPEWVSRAVLCAL